MAVLRLWQRVGLRPDILYSFWCIYSTVFLLQVGMPRKFCSCAVHLSLGNENSLRTHQKSCYADCAALQYLLEGCLDPH